MYVLLTTWPQGGSGNVGDKLITESAKDFIERETGDGEFRQFFREEDLNPHLEVINQSNGVLMPGFALREPLCPDTYHLVDDLSKIEVPIIPLGSGWKSYPGDFNDNQQKLYSEETVRTIKEIANQISHFGCREYYTKRILKRHGIRNASMVGDCAWYDIDSFGTEMHRPSQIDDLVFTTPHSGHYEDQAIKMVNMLAEIFPGATLYCSFHSEPTPHEERIRTAAESRGFDIITAANDLSKIEFYANADLHVGYRVHGHIAFLRKRRPSVLLSEDGRGIGFSETFGHKTFPAFTRRLTQSVYKDMPSGRSLERVVERKKAASSILVEEVEQYLREEMRSGFRRLQHIPAVIDSTYPRMKETLAPILPEDEVS